MIPTRDETRWEGYAVAAGGCWDGFLRLTYPSPLDTGSWVKTVDCVTFSTRLSPVTATGATEYIVPFRKGETTGRRES